MPVSSGRESYSGLGPSSAPLCLSGVNPQSDIGASKALPAGLAIGCRGLAAAGGEANFSSLPAAGSQYSN